MDIKISYDADVTGFGYRQADVKNVVMTIETDYREPGDERRYKELHNKLAKMAGIRPDNHQTFAVWQNDGRIVMRFSDWKIIVGTDVVIGRW